MRSTAIILILFFLPGCLSVCPDSHDREAKERLFSLEEPSVLEQAASERINASDLASNDEIRHRVLWMSAEETSKRLGSFLAETRTSFTWRFEDRQVRMSEKAILELSENGDFLVSIRNDRDLGMELRWVNGVSYEKARQGTFHERRADRAEHEKWREESLSQIRTLLEIASGKVQFARTGTGSHEGRDVILYALANVSTQDKSSLPPPPPSWAREPVYPSDGPSEALKHRLRPFEKGTPTRVTGELWIDNATGTILHADIKATVQVPAPENSSSPPARLDFEVKRTIKGIGRSRIVDKPDHVPFARRPRAVKDPLDWWPPFVEEREREAAAASEK